MRRSMITRRSCAISAEKFVKFYSMTQNNYEALGHTFVPNPYAVEVDATHA